MKNIIRICLLLCPLLVLISCGSSSQNVDLNIEFSMDNDRSWESGFADYPAADESIYHLSSGYMALPPPLDGRSGLSVRGTNRSDDLFMFIKKKVKGFQPHTHYNIQFEITFATNAPTGCVGTGGAPGESVYIKAGASATEPMAVDDGSGFLLMNIDKGNQRIGGADAITIGDFANSSLCEGLDFSYELKTLSSKTNDFSVITDESGAFWVLFATDSGYESTTDIYYLSGRMILNR